MARSRDLWIILRGRDEASRVFRSFGRTVGTTTAGAAGDVSRFDRAMQTTSMRLTQFGLAAQLTGAALAGMGAAGLAFIKSAVEVAAEYDRQARKTLTQVDEVGVSLQDVAQIGRNVARQIGVPFEDLQETLFFIFSSIDVSAKDSEEILKRFAKAAVAGQVDIERAAIATIGVMNAFQLGVGDLGRIQDVQFQIVRKGIITYEELSSVIGRALPATQRAGQTFETLGGMLAFMTRNSMSAAMASTSAARALESFAHPTVVGRLEDMVIAVRDQAGEYRPLLDVMRDMNELMADMTQPQRTALLQELFKGAGGTIQARRFWDLAFKNFGDFEKRMAEMEDSSGAFESAYSKMVGAVSTQSELLRNKWMLIKEAIGRALLPVLLQFMRLLGQALDWFDRLSEPVKSLIAHFMLWGSIIAVVVGGFLLLVGMLAFVIGGIMSAGVAIFVVVGVMFALIAGLIALGAALFVAWQKSENFRAIVRNVINAVKELGSIVVGNAKAIWDSFKSTVLPALQELWEMIEARILPVVRDFITLVKREFIPVFEDVAKFIKDRITSAFQFITHAIEEQLIPAFRDLADWYKQNEETIDSLVQWLAFLAKWFGIAAGVVIFIFVTALGTGIMMIAALIQAFIFAWNMISAIIKAFIDESNKLGESMDNLMNDIGMVWSVAWRAVRDFFVLIWNSTIAYIKFAFRTIKDIFVGALNFLREQWNAAWERVSNFFRTIWNGIKSFFSNSMSTVRNVLSNGVNFIRDRWNSGLNALRNKASDVWANIKSKFRTAIDNIKGFFTNAKTWLFNAGKNIVQGLIDGIKNMFGALGDVAGDLASKVADKFPGSPVKEGPLRVLNRGHAGQEIVKMIASGMLDNQRLLSQASHVMARGIDWTGQGEANPFLTRGFGSPPPPSAPPPDSRPPAINQTFNITTQEIDPTKHAAELGWMVARRM